MQEDGWLGYFGLAQVLISAFKHDIRDLELQDVVRFLEHVLGFGKVVVQVLAHSHKLGPLTGENVCFNHGLI